MRLFIASVALALVCHSTGCTHRQLRNSTLKQASTWTDLQYQQVLGNLASFCDNPGAMANFSVTGSGLAQVTDSGSPTAVVQPNFIALSESALTGGMYGGTMSRQVSEQWEIAPITDPDKLKALSCLYRLLLNPDLPEKADCIILFDSLLGKGKINPEAEGDIPRGWFGIGRKHDVPRNACYVANHRNTYVWVCPEGVFGLSQFTLQVLNIVTVDTAPATEQVQLVTHWQYGGLIPVPLRTVTFTQVHNDAPQPEEETPSGKNYELLNKHPNPTVPSRASPRGRIQFFSPQQGRAYTGPAQR